MSKYDAIHDVLTGDRVIVEYTLDDLAAMVPGGLPKSAYRWEIWWRNDDPSHSHCQSWGSAGYRAVPDLPHRRVRFVRK